MPVHDYATVQVFEADDLVQVFFAYDPSLTEFMREIKGRWNGQRRCWEVRPQYARRPSGEIAAAISERLFETAPPGWRGAVPQLRALACVTRGYEIHAGPGGLRFGLPPGHPSEYRFKEVPDARQDGRKWVVPARSCGNPVIKEVIRRMVREDWEKYQDWMEPTRGRCLVGDVCLDSARADAVGLSPGGVVFAALAFIKKADPKLADMPVREAALRVGKAERTGDALVRVRLDYAELKPGYDALKARLVDDARRPGLEGDDATGDWLQKRL